MGPTKPAARNISPSRSASIPTSGSSRLRTARAVPSSTNRSCKSQSLQFAQLPPRARRNEGKTFLGMFSGENIMTRIRQPRFARSIIFFATIVSGLALLVGCESTQTQQTTAEEIPETVLITGSLIRGGGGGISPWPQYSVPSGPRPAAPAPQASGGLRANIIQGAVPNTEKYPDATPNPVKVARQDPVSTFSIDVDTAAYTNVRRFLNDGMLPPPDAVRVEELVNYFNYSYPTPEDRSAPFASVVAVYPSPWNRDTQILHIGIKGFDVPRTE